MERRAKAGILGDIFCLLLDETSSSSSSSSDDGELVEPKVPRDLVKTRSYFEVVEKMNNEDFRFHFRLGRGKFIIGGI